MHVKVVINDDQGVVRFIGLVMSDTSQHRYGMSSGMFRSLEELVLVTFPLKSKES